ncbi:MAG TPA: response regulator [Bacillota bacterium]|nr:response regulator [Bacillota bacterium]
MRFFIVDDDKAVRMMIAEIIEDLELGEVVGEAEDGSMVDLHVLMMNRIDILIIDLLMPIRDGISTVRELMTAFNGKIIMISQVESKEMIGEAYSLGVEYYITKPINRVEVHGIIQRVSENVRLQKSIYDIQKTLNVLGFGKSKEKKEDPFTEANITSSARFILSELGMLGESGTKDLLDMMDYLFQYYKETPLKNHEFPSLKGIFLNIALKKCGESLESTEVKKEMKAAEQRIRRAICQALNHLASLGLTDYANPKFENYAAKFFDFTEIRKKMLELENDEESSQSPIRINTKKFVQVLYIESIRLMR